MITIDLDPLFIATDYTYPLQVTDTSNPPKAVNVASWQLSFMLKRKITDDDSKAVLEKTNGSGLSVSGTFSDDPAVNQQTIFVVFANADTVNLKPFDFQYELKRMDPGFKSLIAQGVLPLKASVHRS